jgi:hypothetical protein
MRWPLWEQSLLSDQSPTSWLSSAQLLGASFVACRLGLDRTLNPWLAAWLASAIALLSIDEQFMLHEYWKFGCSSWISLCSYAWVRELPTICIVVVGTLTLIHLATSVPGRGFRLALYSSLGVGLLALCIDLTGSPALIAPFEEAIEVSAEALFIGALLIIGPAPDTRANQPERTHVHSP